MRSQGGGRILAIGSRAAVEASPERVLRRYQSCSGFASRTIAAENKDRCISANVILPGTIDTRRIGNPTPRRITQYGYSRARWRICWCAWPGTRRRRSAALVIPIYGADL